MTTFAFPTFAKQIEQAVAVSRVPEKRAFDEQMAAAVRKGLSTRPKRLPPWLFYDKTGSRLFDEITERPEYYLTRTEHAILAEHAATMIASAADGARLRITELGAGSAGKTRLLLKAAVARQQTVVYEPLDVSASALDAAKMGIERDIAGVIVAPQVIDYTQDSPRGLKRRLVRGPHRRQNYDVVQGIDFEPAHADERRLVLYIGSSIGNFEPHEALRILQRVRAGLNPGDSLLLGVDLVKDTATLLAAYDDFAGVTADFNLNMLVRLNRELEAEFYLDSFEHRAVWNQAESRIEMHLESRIAQKVAVTALNLEVEFEQGETIHTENSYKYSPGQVEAMFADAGFATTQTWTDEQGWFNVYLGSAV